MKIRKIEHIPEWDRWEIGFTVQGSRKWLYEYVVAQDEMKAYIKGMKLAIKYEKEQLNRDLDAWKTIKKLMPNVDVSKEIKQTKKLLTGVNK